MFITEVMVAVGVGVECITLRGVSNILSSPLNSFFKSVVWMPLIVITRTDDAGGLFPFGNFRGSFNQQEA